MPPVIAIGILESQYIHSSLAPWCLAAGLRCHAPQLDCAVEESTVNCPPEQLADALLRHSPAVVGLSCYIWNIRETEQVAALLRAARPQLPILFGGPEVSWCAKEVFARCASVDYILCGEGEEPFARLAALLTGDAPPAEAQLTAIPGVATRLHPNAAAHTSTGDWPSPYSPAYFAALRGRIAYLETSRGCPFRCAFCLSGRCGSVRFLPQERAEREILQLANSGTQTVKFIDRTFNCNTARAMRLWRFIIDHYGIDIPAGVRFHFEIGGDLLDKESLALLATAPKGSMQFEIGLQSFHTPTLQAIRRTSDLEKLCANIRALLAPGNVHVHIDLIAGLPLEDYTTFADSFNTAYALGAHQLQLGFLKLLHGAALRDTADADGCAYDPLPPYQVTSTPQLSAAELTRLQGIEDAVERLANSGRFAGTLAYLLAVTSLMPFTLFERIGDALTDTDPASMSLDDYTAQVQQIMLSLPGVDADALRDVLVCDRLASNRTGRLPPCLQRTDPDGLKAAAKALPPRQPGVRRGLALLYGSSRIVWADYSDSARDPITGHWPLHFLPIPAAEK